MNPQAGVAAVEAVSGAQRPLATLQALAEALGALSAAHASAAESATPDVDATMTEAPSLPEAVPPSSSALAAQAAQGQATLGQLAADPAIRRTAGHDAAGSGNLAADTPTVARHEPAPEGFNTPRLPDLLAVPVTVTALHTPPLGAPRAQGSEAAPRRVQRDEGRPGDGGAAHDEAAPDAVADLLDTDTGAGPAVAADACDPEALWLRAALERAGRADAAAELQRGRRLLLVLPQGGTVPQQAWAWLLSARRAQRHAARWWPGAAGSDGWLPWRVFRDGDPQLGRGLVSRASGPACRVRLGPQPPRLQDAAAASLEIAERIRFAQSLGGQWSLLLLAAPAGWAP